MTSVAAWRQTPVPASTLAARPAPYKTKDGSTIQELMHPSVHGNQAQSLAEATVPAGTRTTLHRHLKTEEIYHIVGGRGMMTLGEKTFPVGRGDTVLIPPETPHRIETVGAIPLRILCCCAPAYRHDDTELLEVHKVAPPPRRKSQLSTAPLSKLLAPSPDPVRHLFESSKLVGLRSRFGGTQHEFWGRVFVTQSGGCRYEAGREIPQPTQLMIQFVYGTDKESKKLCEALRKPFQGRLDDTASIIADLDTGESAARLREALRLNQTAFWGAVAVTQSAGSRYEGQRKMPRSVRALLQLVFGPETAAQQLLEQLRSHGLKPRTSEQRQGQ